MELLASLFGTFKGGVHPPGYKDRTAAKPIERMPPPEKVFVPLQQHAGAPCKPLVKPGDEVAEGQKIGEPVGYISAPVHASVSGVVAAVDLHPHPVLAAPSQTVVIEGKGAAPKEWNAHTDWSAMPPEALLDKIARAGIVGMGGAGFPTQVKLLPPKEARIDTLIVNGVECEPYLTSDDRLMVERAREVVEGVRILLKILRVPRAYIAIEKNKPEAIRIMREQTADRSLWGDAQVEVAALSVKYPQGAEKQLIRTLLGREVPSGGLPFQIGVVVQNVGTAFAIYEAVVKDKPLIERVVTVSGDRLAEPKNLLVRIGTRFADVIAHAGGILPGDRPLKMTMGGPMMGIAQYTADVPVIKGTSGILVCNDVVGSRKVLPCVKCGRCVDICPMSLMPCRLAAFAERDDFASCEAARVRDCIECGACTYICMSNRPIVHDIKYAKLALARARKP